jgi:hypothetical protein
MKKNNLFVRLIFADDGRFAGAFRNVFWCLSVKTTLRKCA